MTVIHIRRREPPKLDLAEIVGLVDRLEAAAHGLIPAAAQYATDWAPPEDIERWYTAEQLLLHQADLQRLRQVLEDLLGVTIGRGA